MASWSLSSRMTTGTSPKPAMRKRASAARRATSWYPPVGSGRTSNGWMTPCSRMESARSARADSSNSFLGWLRLGSISEMRSAHRPIVGGVIDKQSIQALAQTAFSDCHR